MFGGKVCFLLGVFLVLFCCFGGVYALNGQPSGEYLGCWKPVSSDCGIVKGTYVVDTCWFSHNVRFVEADFWTEYGGRHLCRVTVIRKHNGQYLQSENIKLHGSLHEKIRVNIPMDEEWDENDITVTLEYK